MMQPVFLLVVVCALSGSAFAFNSHLNGGGAAAPVSRRVLSGSSWNIKTRVIPAKPILKMSEDDIEETTKKYGLEAGLYKAITTKDGGEANKSKPSDLLKKYGIAYLATSITLAIISYALCYVLVSNGVDVASLLEKVGITASETASNAGTAGIAYAIHKAASPIRFPPTVALTPVVASWIGKKPVEEDTTTQA
jgi:Protein of unknown function (DUF1279)